MKVVRIILSLVAALFSVIFIGIAFTSPMITATTPALFGIALAVVAFFMWPRKGKVAA